MNRAFQLKLWDDSNMGFGPFGVTQLWVAVELIEIFILSAVSFSSLAWEMRMDGVICLYFFSFAFLTEVYG